MSAGARRARATFWLLGAPDSLAAQSYRDPDGTGLGWFDEEGAPRVRKQAMAAHADVAFAREAREVSSSTFVAHIRFASTGSLTLANTHPFEQRGRLFAHNGVIEDLEALDRHLGDALAFVRGETDSERLFALITREIEAREGDVGAGIEAACKWVAAHLPLLAINFVLSTEHDLWALRYPQIHGLYMLERPAGAGVDHSSKLGMRVRSEHGSEEPLIVIASEPMDPDAGWRPLRAGVLTHIDRDLEIREALILPRPPVRALTLADLSQRARSSQAARPAPA